jgi:hypothetical protein
MMSAQTLLRLLAKGKPVPAFPDRALRLFPPFAFTLERLLLDLERNSPLPFPLALKDGGKIATVGEAADFLSLLTDDQRECVHWRTTILMFNHAMKEARYLTTAAVNLRTALTYDRLLAHDAE